MCKECLIYLDESAPDLLQAGTLLHTDDSDVIFLVDPDDEVLGLVHEDTSANLHMIQKVFIYLIKLDERKIKGILTGQSL